MPFFLSLKAEERNHSHELHPLGMSSFPANAFIYRLEIKQNESSATSCILPFGRNVEIPFPQTWQPDLSV